MSELVRRRLQDTIASATNNVEFLTNDIAKERVKITTSETAIARHEADICKEQEAAAEAERLLGLMPSVPDEECYTPDADA